MYILPRIKFNHIFLLSGKCMKSEITPKALNKNDLSIVLISFSYILINYFMPRCVF